MKTKTQIHIINSNEILSAPNQNYLIWPEIRISNYILVKTKMFKLFIFFFF